GGMQIFSTRIIQLTRRAAKTANVHAHRLRHRSPGRDLGRGVTIFRFFQKYLNARLSQCACGIGCLLIADHHKMGETGYRKTMRGDVQAMRYEMVHGKLMLSIYTSAKGFDTAAEDNSFNEYIGDVTTATWTPKKEVFVDLKHIARSAQYHALLSMTKVSIPTI